MHSKTVCSVCGKIITQCRCMDCNKTVVLAICKECAANTIEKNVHIAQQTKCGLELKS